ncbi:MAG: UvrD-helicase domain-containing protein [Deltaproteobacteria bacterium]|nr:UvrD-helicase domain-containing protein [Deltaproteobacteria bacterium]
MSQLAEVGSPLSLSLSEEEARQRAATALGTTFLVEAGAGTGKTSVLLQRLLALVRNGHSQLERLAAITFTEKAAAELRVRLRAEIGAALAGSLSEGERRNLREARSQLERAQISTVHAWCAALLRERAVEARVDPNFTVLDEFGADLLRAETWREWLAEEMERSPDILKQALRAGVTLTHLETLRDFVLEHRDCLSLLPVPVELRSVEFRSALKSGIIRLSALGASCSNTADRALAQIKALGSQVPATENDALWERLLLRALPLSTKVGAKTNWRPAAALEEVRAWFGRLSDAHAQVRAAASHNLSVGLVRWLDGYLAAYQEKKRERSTLDFVDLLLFTRDLLKHDVTVRRYYQRKFHFLLVDEFQDTDPLQAEIIFFLAEREPRATDWTAVTLHPGKLFLVGDPQQSIYRFRRADLEVYVQARTVVARQGEILSLTANFRTLAPTLGWINETFVREFGRVEMEQLPYRPLTAARQQDTQQEIIVLPVPEVSAKASREELRQAEARTVVAFLTHTAGRDDLPVWGGQTVNYRDIAVLFRTYQAMEAYEEALQDAGVPYRVLGGRRYASRPEIEELRALLRAIDSPSDAIAVVATLRSSVFGFSDEDLALFVAAEGRFDYTRAPLLAPFPAAAYFTAAFALLRDLHARRAQVSPAALLSEIFTRTHLLPIFALRPHGVQRVANLLKLVDTARVLAEQGLQTLTALNRFLAQQHEVAEEAESPVIEDHDSALRLLTIHKAKGLEFPVVILADAVYTQRQLSRTGVIDRVAGSLELQIGPRTLTCTTQGWQKAEGQEQVRDAAEERRLWYVAATRVRDHLVIPVISSAQRSVRGEQWVFADESLSAVVAEEKAAGSRVFVYQGPVHPVERPAPALPAAAAITSVSPEPAALRAYQEWESRLQATLTRGRERGTINAVTEFFPGDSKVSGSAAWQAGVRLGRAVHETLKQAGDSTPVPALSRFSNLTERERVQHLINTALASSVLRRAKTATECFSALPFVLHGEGRLLEGILDFAFIETGAWVVVEVKIEAVAGAEAEERALVYRPQLYASALALEQLTHRPVKELLCLFLHSGQEVGCPWGEDERRSAQTLLPQAAHSLLTSE